MFSSSEKHHDQHADAEETKESGDQEESIEQEDEEQDEDDGSVQKQIKVHIDMQSIPCIPREEQDAELQDLGVVAYEQRSYEQGVLQQVDDALKGHLDAPKPGSSKERIQAILSFQSTDESVENLASSTAPPISDSQPSSSLLSRPSSIHLNNTQSEENDDEKIDEDKISTKDLSDEDYKPSDEEVQSDDEGGTVADNFWNQASTKRSDSTPSSPVHKRLKSIDGPQKVSRSKACVDDGDDVTFEKRIKHVRREQIIQREMYQPDQSSTVDNEEFSYDEAHEVSDGFKVPLRIWSKLYPYQQTGVEWFWELHQLAVGGIMGDEMGLGKTIQVIAFLAGLSISELSSFRDEHSSLGPVILVAPVTVMHQWVAEFHKWWPFFRVAILHQTGSFQGVNKQRLIRKINSRGGILITSYCSINSYQDILYNYDWHYVILDEGHKIRNPDAQTTLACKRFRTPHRIILSGSPIQNNLKELWSLFDFIYPGKLGTLPVFMEKFAVPITQGGYANASQVQVEIAYKCATVLRDAIKPYLLRRAKEEVQMSLNLPDKNEQVLFCRLTDEQRQAYKTYLDSGVVRDILGGKFQIFVGLINLRKICNHPDLFTDGPKEESDDVKDSFGYYKRSGKMKVIDVLLRLWHGQGHKVLLFTQGRQMLNILEKFLIYREYTYLTMDGSTAIGSRRQIVKEFNENRNIFVFLLTTRVGGIGLNLIGANRIIIFDPDWNPTTDMQARERAWRIGQSKQVTIYRLLTAGTVEEKIYHRQVFKQYLTNKVLKDPKQRRFFKTNDLYELFTLGSDSGTTESSAVFAGTGSKVKVDKKAKNIKAHKLEKNNEKSKVTKEVKLSQQKIEELREKARRLSKMFAQKFQSNSDTSLDVQIPSTSSSTASQSKPVEKKNENLDKDLHEKPKKKKKKKGTVFEGERIKYLAKSDVFKPSSVEPSDCDVSKQQDDYVLKKLFKKSKVHSALQHDVIEGSRRSDYALVESEADKVASEAIKALKSSRQMCFSASDGIPTWTGNQQTMPTFRNLNRAPKLFGSASGSVSSQDLMKSIRERNKFDKIDGESKTDEKNPSVENLLGDIRNFIAFQSNKDGEASTKELLDRFKNKIEPEQTPLFKSLLWKICDFHRRSDKSGYWTLKTEFR
ncbi:DNA excision repair protein ERCC-6-like [Brevipalpus obovatus]|uniref:DNA excision repair protein ERCC-6-like n=1 Tax=Brevipalpus obovatus TaxID=246614 RepID=UPI003D9F7895